MKVAVIVLNYNSSSDCKKCIGYLFKQEGVELDIIVVDNCSSTEDRTNLEEILNSYSEDEKGCHIITYLPNDVNKGYNAGNNIGLRYANEQGYKYALISNPDMEYPNVCYISRMVDVMKENTCIGVQATDIINNDGKHQNPLRELSYWEESLWPLEIFKNIRSNKWYSMPHDKSCYCEKVSGCCLLLSLTFVAQIGFFDQNVFLYSEESILAKQVSLVGYKTYYNSEISAIHRHIEKAKGNPKPRMKALFSSRQYYLENYSGYSQFALSLLLLSKKIQKLCTVGL